MKNKEKYAKEIAEQAVKDAQFGFHKDLDKITSCNGIQCQNCLFRGPRLCSITRREWANAEYKEPKQFTYKEIEFVRLFPEIQYIAREKGGKLIAYLEKPVKDKKLGWWLCKIDPCAFFEIRLGDFLKFESIQWEDEEPTSREEILRGSDE